MQRWQVCFTVVGGRDTLDENRFQVQDKKQTAGAETGLTSASGDQSKQKGLKDHTIPVFF